MKANKDRGTGVGFSKGIIEQIRENSPEIKYEANNLKISDIEQSIADYNRNKSYNEELIPFPVNTVCKEHEWVGEGNLNINGKKRIYTEKIRSCNKEYYRKHKKDRYAKEYRIWRGIKNRCLYKTCKEYKYYGEKGIRICDRWLVFENFLNDVGEAPSEKHSLDRFPNKTGNYEPGNFRWATMREQGMNRKDNVYIEYNGETHTKSEWERILKLPPCTLNYWYTNKKHSLDYIINRFSGAIHRNGRLVK